jgi:ketosteroid isomerase-like protein
MRSLRLLGASVVAATAFAGAAAAGDNSATVQNIYAAFGGGDIPAVLAQLSDDVAWDCGYDGTAIPFLTPRNGLAEVAEFFQGLAGLEFRKFEVLNILEGGNQVAAVVDLDLVVRATGKPVVDQELHLWTIGDDGKVTAFRHFADVEELAAALAN